MERCLVVFQANDERTEALALALGLGAVEGMASIRLRHLSPLGLATLEHQSYGRLKVDDLLWADCVGIVVESCEVVGEFEELTAILRQFQIRDRGEEKKRIAYVHGPKADCPSVIGIEQELKKAGLSIVTEDQSPGTDRAYLTSVGLRLANGILK